MRRVCDQQGFAWAVLLFWKQTFALMIGVVSWTLEVSLKLVVWVFFPFSSCLPLNPSCILCGHQADADAWLSVPGELAQREAA